MTEAQSLKEITDALEADKEDGYAMLKENGAAQMLAGILHTHWENGYDHGYYAGWFAACNALQEGLANVYEPTGMPLGPDR